MYSPNLRELKTWARRVDAVGVHWKVVVGIVILVISAVRLVSVLLDFEGGSYGVGQLTAGMLFCLLGAWLIHSGRQQAKKLGAGRAKVDSEFGLRVGTELISLRRLRARVTQPRLP